MPQGRNLVLLLIFVLLVLVILWLLIGSLKRPLPKTDTAPAVGDRYDAERAAAWGGTADDARGLDAGRAGAAGAVGAGAVGAGAWAASRGEDTFEGSDAPAAAAFSAEERAAEQADGFDIGVDGVVPGGRLASMADGAGIAAAEAEAREALEPVDVPELADLSVDPDDFDLPEHGLPGMTMGDMPAGGGLDVDGALPSTQLPDETAVDVDGVARVDGSDVGAPAWDAPDVSVPDVDVAAVDVPAVDVPQVSVPDVDIAAVDVPAVDVPQVSDPEVDIAAVDVPDVTVSDVDVPAVDVAAVDMPEVSVPDMDVPAADVPDASLPEGGVPAVDLPEVSLPHGDIPEASFADGDASGWDGRDASLMDLDVPATDLPAVDLPEASLSETEMPEASFAEGDVSAMDVPEVNVPDVDVPEVAVDVPEVDGVAVDAPEVVDVPEVDEVAVDMPEVDEVAADVPAADVPEADESTFAVPEAHSDWVAEATTGPNWDAQADVTSETTDNALGETREVELSATVAPLPAASADSGSGEVRGRLGSLAAGAAGLAGAGIAGAASRIAAFRRDRQADASADATEGDPHVATASPFADPWNAKPPVAAIDDAAVQGDAMDDDVPSPGAEATAESSWTAPEGDVVTEESSWAAPEGGAVAADDGLSDGDVVAEESSWSDGAVEPSSLEEVAAAVDTDAVAEAGGVNLVWDGETVSDAGDAAAVEVAAGEGGDVVHVEESAWSVDAPAEDAAPSNDAPAGAEADGTSADVAQVEESSWSDADVEPSSLDEVAAAVDTEAVAEAGGVNLVWDGNPDASAESVGTDAEVQAWPVDDGAEQRVVEGSDGSDEVQAWPVDDTSSADGDTARDADAASGEGSESGHVGGYGDHGYGAHEAASAYGPPDDAGDAGGDSVVVHDHAVIDGGWSVGSAAPIEDGCMPLGHPIKGVYALGIYQVPGSGWYDQTTPDVWFLDEEAAQRAGFRRGEG